MLNETYSIILALFAAGAAGLVGAFALMKKTILAGDVMSHVAIPGLGLAIIWQINPLIGGALTLFIGAFIISKLERKTSISSEAAIGVIFASSVALGALLLNSEEELIDALFGGFGNLYIGEFIFGIAASVFIVAALWLLRNKLIIGLFSEELAAATKIRTGRLNFWFLSFFFARLFFQFAVLGGASGGRAHNRARFRRPPAHAQLGLVPSYFHVSLRPVNGARPYCLSRVQFRIGADSCSCRRRDFRA